MKNDQMMREAMQIIANASQINIDCLEQVFLHPTYRIFTIPKRSGGKRLIHAPVGITKDVQNALYYNFLKKISTGPNISSHCFGIPKRSWKDNVNQHLSPAPSYVVDIDLKDAFHCVDTVSLEKALADVFFHEVCLYKDRYVTFIRSVKNLERIQKRENKNEDDVLASAFQYSADFISKDARFQEWLDDQRFSPDVSEAKPRKRPLLFPNKLVRDFRKQVRTGGVSARVHELCECMASILAKVLTHEGRLVQGCPTSPILMALVVSYTQLLHRFKDFEPENISIYVDGITFGTYGATKTGISEKLRGVIRGIEEDTVWKFNMDKIHVYDTNREQPLVTGLRLVRNRKTRQELITMMMDKVKYARKHLKAWIPWYYFKPTIPKKTQRKIRAVLHRACLDAAQEEFLRNHLLQSQAKGYIGYVFHVYQTYTNIPSQLKKALHVYEDEVDQKVFVRIYNKEVA